jgi:hypothetical protein
MADAIDTPALETLPDTDLVTAIRAVLESSPEPMTVSRLRSKLPANLRSVAPESLLDVLRRQVAANVLVQYPKYRSPQERFWDRPMEVHLACLLRSTLEEKPMPWSELRRKLPDYAKTQAENILEQQVVKGVLHRHPPVKSRTGPRFGVRPADPRDYLRSELTEVFERLTSLGFTRGELRAAALDLLHEEEWSSPAAASSESPESPPSSDQENNPGQTA